MNIIKVLVAVEMLDNLGLQLEYGPFIGGTPPPPKTSDVDLYILKRGIDALEKMATGSNQHSAIRVIVGTLVYELIPEGPETHLTLLENDTGLHISTPVYRVVTKRRRSLSAPSEDLRRRVLHEAPQALHSEEELMRLIAKHTQKESDEAAAFLHSSDVTVEVRSEVGAELPVVQAEELDKYLVNASTDVLHGLYLLGVELLNLSPGAGRLMLSADTGDVGGKVDSWVIVKEIESVNIRRRSSVPELDLPTEELWLQSTDLGDLRPEVEEVGDMESLTEHEKIESRTRESVQAILNAGYGLYPFKKGQFVKFESIDIGTLPKDNLLDLYWLMMDKERLVHNGEVGTNSPCGITFGLSAYFILDYCFESETVMVTLSTYVDIMETVPEGRRLYIGSSGPLEDTALEERIRHYTQL